MSNFHFSKYVEKRAKTVLKSMHFACVFRHSVETSFKKKTLKNRRLCEQFSHWLMRGKHGKNRLEINKFCMRFETFCLDKFEKKNMQKKAFLWVIFTLVNVCKTRGKTVLKLMDFACVLRHFVGKNLKKKTVQKTAFLWAIFTLVNPCITLANSVLKWIYFSFVLKYIVETSLKKKCNNGVFMSNFLFVKCVENTCKNFLEMKPYCIRFETLCGDTKEKKTC